MVSQDIREKVFEKAVFGGYDMGGVDDFLDEIAAEVDRLGKENQTLRAKMKVLVDKIEEYRGSEDAMRMTLVSAQKLAGQIEEEAKVRAAKILEDANTAAETAYERIRTETAVEQSRLNTAKESVSRYFAEARAVCRNQLDLLDRLATADPQAEAEVTETVRSIESHTEQLPEPAPKLDIESEMGMAAERIVEEDDEGATRMFFHGTQN